MSFIVLLRFGGYHVGAEDIFLAAGMSFRERELP
jgi:hypothetical protein